MLFRSDAFSKNKDTNSSTQSNANSKQEKAYITTLISSKTDLKNSLLSETKRSLHNDKG